LCLSTTNILFTAYVYGEYRSKHSDQNTVKDVLKDLQENNIDVSQLVMWPKDNCQRAEYSAGGGSSA
jgi:hypothetical protein